MHPVLFDLGPVRIHSYGLMLFLAISTAFFLMRTEVMRRGETGAFARRLCIVAVAGGWFGSKFWYLAEHPDVFLADPLRGLFTGTGQVYWGALLGGTCAYLVLLRLTRRSFVEFTDVLFPTVMAANGIGRLGCMLSGDGDYGVPSRLPFPLAVDMSAGLVPPHRHPGLASYGVTAETPVLNTPLIEAVVLVGLALWLHGRHRHDPPVGWAASLCLVLMGFERFVIEFWRLNADLVGPLSGPQVVGLAAGLVGLAFFLPREARRRRREQGAAG